MQTSDGYVTMQDGVRLYFQKIGRGAEVVVIPNGLCFRDDFRHLGDWRTLIFYDVRNRGRSDTVTEPAKLARGIQQDVDDLDVVRRHFGIEQAGSDRPFLHRIDGRAVRDEVRRARQTAWCRLVPRSPMPRNNILRLCLIRMRLGAQVMAQDRRDGESSRRPAIAEEVCQKFWAVLRQFYVVDPKDAHRVDWGRCDLANELHFHAVFASRIMPSIRASHLTPDEIGEGRCASVGRARGQRPHRALGGSRDWALTACRTRGW